jgi:hypothetical protein
MHAIWQELICGSIVALENECAELLRVAECDQNRFCFDAMPDHHTSSEAVVLSVKLRLGFILYKQGLIFWQC